MRYLIAIIFIINVICCKNTSSPVVQANNNFTQTLDFGDFKIKTPKEWRKIKERGIDSYVGGLTNGTDTLEFDFGQYSNDLTDTREEYLYADDTINGKAGYIAKPKIKGKGFIGVYFGNIDGDNFNLCSRHPKNEKEIISIFQNIRFKTSDTTRNTRSIKFGPRVENHKGNY